MNRRLSTRARGATAISLFLFPSSLLSFPALADEPPNPDSARLEGARAEGRRPHEGDRGALAHRQRPAPVPQPAVRRPALGLGPSASKVYAKKGVSIGGYGEILYQNFSGTLQDGTPSNLTPTIDVARAVLYFGYKFDDHFVFNSEIEYEHAVAASDKEGEVEVEFAYLDWLSGKRAFNARAGLMLIPVGLINQLHEPPVFLGARRPDVETVILPSTWREIGFGAWGDAGPFSYRLYLVNGLNAAGYAADGLREGRQEGSLALARNFALTGRLDYTGLPGVLVGASFFTGNSGQGQVTPAGESFDARTTFVDFHLDAKWRGASFRALWAQSTVGDAAAINQVNNFEGDESVGKRQTGWYVEAGFDVLSLVRAIAHVPHAFRALRGVGHAGRRAGRLRAKPGERRQAVDGGPRLQADSAGRRESGRAVAAERRQDRRQPAQRRAGVRVLRHVLFVQRDLPLLSLRRPLFLARASPHAGGGSAPRVPDGATVRDAEDGVSLRRLTGAEVARRTGGAPPHGLVAYYVRDGSDGNGRRVPPISTRTSCAPLPETLLVLVDPKGAIARIEILSFSEPEEYLPRAKRGTAQFSGKTLTRRAVGKARSPARDGRDAHRARHRRGGAARPCAGRVPARDEATVRPG